MIKNCMNCGTEHKQAPPDDAVAYFCSMKCANRFWSNLKEMKR